MCQGGLTVAILDFNKQMVGPDFIALRGVHLLNLHDKRLRILQDVISDDSYSHTRQIPGLRAGRIEADNLLQLLVVLVLWGNRVWTRQCNVLAPDRACVVFCLSSAYR